MTAKGDRAREIMESPEVKEAFENLHNYYLNAFAELPMKEGFEEQVIYDIRRRLHLLGELKADLEKMIQVGNLEDFRAAQQTELGEPYVRSSPGGR